MPRPRWLPEFVHGRETPEHPERRLRDLKSMVEIIQKAEQDPRTLRGWQGNRGLICHTKREPKVAELVLKGSIFEVSDPIFVIHANVHGSVFGNKRIKD